MTTLTDWFNYCSRIVDRIIIASFISNPPSDVEDETQFPDCKSPTSSILITLRVLVYKPRAVVAVGRSKMRSKMRSAENASV